MMSRSLQDGRDIRGSVTTPLGPDTSPLQNNKHETTLAVWMGCLPIVRPPFFSTARYLGSRVFQFRSMDTRRAIQRIRGQLRLFKTTPPSTPPPSPRPFPQLAQFHNKYFQSCMCVTANKINTNKTNTTLRRL